MRQKLLSYFAGVSNILARIPVTRMTQNFERVKQNSINLKDSITNLKNELNALQDVYKAVLTKQLQEENIKLQAEVENAKKKLIQLEIQNGIKQIPIPIISRQNLHTTAGNSEQPPKIIKEIHQEKTTDDGTEQKAKKPKKAKETKPSATELAVDIGRLDLRIGKVESVEKHPEADSLYVLKINCGEDKPRTVCSGLVKHVPIEELKDVFVMVLCNLKPVKMRGITSEAMVMCASGDNKVEVLIPPKNCQPGDAVECEGFQRQPDSVMNPKKKIFETVAPDLHVNSNLEACYKNIPLTVSGKGTFHSKLLKNVPVK